MTWIWTKIFERDHISWTFVQLNERVLVGSSWSDIGFFYDAEYREAFTIESPSEADFRKARVLRRAMR